VISFWDPLLGLLRSLGARQPSYPISFKWGSHAKKKFRLVHIDLFNPIATTLHGRVKYFKTFIDLLFRRTFFHIMKTKFNVLDKLKVFKALVENQTRNKIKTIKCDGGGEYKSKHFNAFCKMNDIMK
jgi:hypothetical protein